MLKAIQQCEYLAWEDNNVGILHDRVHKIAARVGGEAIHQDQASKLDYVLRDFKNLVKHLTTIATDLGKFTVSSNELLGELHSLGDALDKNTLDVTKHWSVLRILSVMDKMIVDVPNASEKPLFLWAQLLEQGMRDIGRALDELEKNFGLMERPEDAKRLGVCFRIDRLADQVGLDKRLLQGKHAKGQLDTLIIELKRKADTEDQKTPLVFAQVVINAGGGGGAAAWEDPDAPYLARSPDFAFRVEKLAATIGSVGQRDGRSAVSFLPLVIDQISKSLARRAQKMDPLDVVEKAERLLGWLSTDHKTSIVAKLEQQLGISPRAETVISQRLSAVCSTLGVMRIWTTIEESIDGLQNDLGTASFSSAAHKYLW